MVRKIEVGFEQAADLNQMRQVMDSNGFDDAVVQLYGSSRDVVIRMGNVVKTLKLKC